MNLNYEEQKNESVYRVSKHMYEAIIDTQGEKELIRLTDKELKLYNRICRQTPHYPLWMFYQTIIAPGAFSRRDSSLAKEAEKENTECLAAENSEEDGVVGPLI